ncbi:MAG: TolC family outer membrane protein [Halothiobacillaceae bacterium]
MRVLLAFTAAATLMTQSYAAWAAPSLVDVFELAAQHDPALAAADAARRAVSEAVPQARAALLPQLSANAAINRTHREIEGINHNTTTQNYTNKLATLSLSQVIYDRQAFVALDQADARVAQAEYEFALALQDLTLRVSQAYSDLLFAADSLKLAESKKEAIAAQKQQAAQMYTEGFGTITDVQEAQARLDLAVAEALEARNLLRTRRQALFKLTGRWIEDVTPLRPDAPMPSPEPNDLDRWLEEARQHALEVKRAEKALEVARLDVERARSNHLPVVRLVGSAQDQSNTDLGYKSDSISYLGVQLSLPLYAGGKVLSVTREALARQEQAAEILRKAAADSESNAVESFHGVNDTIARVRALEQAVRSSEIALDAAQIGLKVGYRTSVDVLNAQQQLFSARRDLLQQRYNHILYLLRLKAAVGSLGPQDIETVDLWLAK